MGTRAAVATCLALFITPCHAGDLEDGIRFHERKDYAKAANAFRKSAANDNAEALRRLGFMYYHGEGVVQDGKRAVVLFEKAAEAGDIQSAFNLAKMHEYGMGVAQDDRQALFWYRKAAEAGDPDAQFNASVLYYKGQGVDRDRSEAAKWWTLATMKGGDVAERWRPSVESAQSKLTPEEMAEGQRRAAEWTRARKPAR